MKLNRLTYRVRARNALFSEPITRAGGEKNSLLVPTYQALKGITESIYFKPSIMWIVERIRVMNPIKTEVKGIRPVKYSGGNDLSFYNYLCDVEYQVEVRFVFNENRPELKEDWNENKHFFIAKRSLERGGRRDIFLGTRECQGYIEPCEFGSGIGHYDSIESMEFGLQYHSIVYADENAQAQRMVKFWKPKMEKGIITFIPPEQCPIERLISNNSIKTFTVGTDFQSVEREFVLAGGQ